jgi:hypothetical protein
VKTDNPDTMNIGARAHFRKGFWDGHLKRPFDPPYRESSPAWQIYRKGYKWAETHPGEIGAWAYNDDQGIRTAFEFAIQQLEKSQPHTARNKAKRKALLEKWNDLLRRRPWQYRVNSAGFGQRSSKGKSRPSTSTR